MAFWIKQENLKQQIWIIFLFLSNFVILFEYLKKSFDEYLIGELTWRKKDLINTLRDRLFGLVYWFNRRFEKSSFHF